MSMNKEEFIKTATAKIYNFNQKQKIKAELTDHIETKESFFIKIGYSKEASEEKALFAMGDAEEISADLSKLYNSFYNPLPDIIFYAVWFLLLGGIYFLLKKYVYNDIGTYSLILFSEFFAISIYWLYITVSAKKNNIFTAICSFISIAATAVFIYYTAKPLNSKLGGSLSNLKDMLFDYKLPLSNYNSSEKMIYAFIAFYVIPALLPAVSNLIYTIKKQNNSNSKTDNTINKITEKSCILIFICSVLLSAAFTVSFFNTQNAIYNKYKTVYNEMINICRSSDNFDDVIKNAENSPLEFIENKDEDGRITEILFDDDIVYFSIKLEQAEEIDTDKVTSYSLFSSLYGTAFPTVKKEYFNSYFTIEKSYFNNDMDSITLSKFKISDSELDTLNRYNAKDKQPEDNFKFYSEHLPISVKYNSQKRNSLIGAYTFSYMSGKKEAKFQSDYYVNFYTPEFCEYINKSNEIIEIIKNNQNASVDEIAELTKTEYIIPYETKEEYKNELLKNYEIFNKVTPSYLENSALFSALVDATYAVSYKFISDDGWFFCLGEAPYTKIAFSNDSDISYLRYDYLTDELTESEYTDPEAVSIYKLSCGGKFYDKNGCFYSDMLRVPYYTEKGEKFILTTELKTNSTPKKVYYLVSSKGNKYHADKCYINSRGYLVIDTDNKITADSTNKFTYKDNNNNQYVKALEASWDNNQTVYNYNKKALN